MAQGLDQPQEDPAAQTVNLIMEKVQQLDPWVGDMKSLLGAHDPSLMPFLEQIGKAAMELANAVQEKASRAGIGRGSSVVPPTPPSNPGAPPPNPNAM